MELTMLAWFTRLDCRKIRRALASNGQNPSGYLSLKRVNGINTVMWCLVAMDIHLEWHSKAGGERGLKNIPYCCRGLTLFSKISPIVSFIWAHRGIWGPKELLSLLKCTQSQYILSIWGLKLKLVKDIAITRNLSGCNQVLFQEISAPTLVCRHMGIALDKGSVEKLVAWTNTMMSAVP